MPILYGYSTGWENLISSNILMGYGYSHLYIEYLFKGSLFVHVDGFKSFDTRFKNIHWKIDISYFIIMGFFLISIKFLKNLGNFYFY